LLNPVPAEHARLLLARGDVARAARWAADSGLAPGGPSGYPRENGYLVLARVLRAQGYVRVFADEGPELAAVLARLIAAQREDPQAAAIPLACLARVQRAFGPGHAAGGGAATDPRPAAGLFEQLTGRELEVLAMLAAGRSNQDIARSLFISLDTVKKHVSHLLAKLGAANRTEAVARGRDLGLID
jgi:LuxR family maltose regulon positive regulatory protein